MSPDSASLSLCRSVLLALLLLERGSGPEPFALEGSMSTQGEGQLGLAVGFACIWVLSHFGCPWPCTILLQGWDGVSSSFAARVGHELQLLSAVLALCDVSWLYCGAVSEHMAWFVCGLTKPKDKLYQPLALSQTKLWESTIPKTQVTWLSGLECDSFAVELGSGCAGCLCRCSPG